jgi:hypothetical protein
MCIAANEQIVTWHARAQAAGLDGGFEVAGLGNGSILEYPRIRSGQLATTVTAVRLYVATGPGKLVAAPANTNTNIATDTDTGIITDTDTNPDIDTDTVSVVVRCTAGGHVVAICSLPLATGGWDVYQHVDCSFSRLVTL